MEFFQTLQKEVIAIAIALGAIAASVSISLIGSLAYYFIKHNWGELREEKIREKHSPRKQPTNTTKYKQETETRILAVAGLLGTSIVAVTQLLQVPELDAYLTISACAFAFAIPILAIQLWLARWTSYQKHDVDWGSLTIWLGAIASVLGLASLFWHFSWLVGISFAIGAGLSTGWLLKRFKITETLNEDEEEQDAYKG
jgi:cation transport ATPase